MRDRCAGFFVEYGGETLERDEDVFDVEGRGLRGGAIPP